MAELSIVFALYPNLTQLDFTGPLEVLARLPQARIVLAASTPGAPLVTGRFVSCCRCSERFPMPAAWCATAMLSPAAA
jgi:hypothetical protein